MAGTLALVGAGEFLDTMLDVDRVLLERAGGRRVVVLPTASAPDGAGVPERWARMGVEHFTKLGAQVNAVLALTRADCEVEQNVERVRAANLVYFSGGKPDYLRETLADTRVWRAVEQVLAQGGVLAGCSAGAMIMGAYVPVFSSFAGVPRAGKWQPSFALVPHAVVMPHYNEFPEAMLNLVMGQKPADTFVIGIDADTALVGLAGTWEALGKRRVTIRRGKTVTRYTHGDQVKLD